MELEIWAKRVELRWHAMIWQQIPSWITRCLPYTFRTHFKCSWNDTRLSNLQNHALHCHSSCHDQISSCFLCNDMITKILWYEIMNPVSRVKKMLSKPLMYWLIPFQFPNLHLIWSQRSLVKSNHENFFKSEKASFKPLVNWIMKLLAQNLHQCLLT